MLLRQSSCQEATARHRPIPNIPGFGVVFQQDGASSTRHRRSPGAKGVKSEWLHCYWTLHSFVCGKATDSVPKRNLCLTCKLPFWKDKTFSVIRWPLGLLCCGCFWKPCAEPCVFTHQCLCDFVSLTLWSSNSPDLNPDDHSIWSVGLMQGKVYRSRIAIKRQRTWNASDRRVGTLWPVNRGCCYRGQWRRRLSACVRGAGHTSSTKHKVSAILSCICQKLLNWWK